MGLGAPKHPHWDCRAAPVLTAYFGEAIILSGGITRFLCHGWRGVIRGSDLGEAQRKAGPPSSEGVEVASPAQ